MRPVEGGTVKAQHEERVGVVRIGSNKFFFCVGESVAIGVETGVDRFCGIPDEADVVEDAPDIALRAVAGGGIVGGVAGFGIAALAARAVDVDDGYPFVHGAHAAPETDIGAGGGVAGEVGGAAPVPWIVRIASHIDNLRSGEDRVDGGKGGGGGRTGVVHNALQLFGVGQAPVGVVGKGRAFSVGESAGPVHAGEAVGLRPHEAGRLVGDGAVAVVREVIDSVSGVSSAIVGVIGPP